jgi:protein gp37
MNRRLGTGLDFKPGHRADVEIFLDEKMLIAPLRWKKPCRIFVNSMSDTFAEFVKDEWLDRMFAVMALCPQHTFQVLTKRPERMRAYLELLTEMCDGEDGISETLRWIGEKADIDWRNGSDKWPLPHVWLGISAEDQATADERIPLLLQTPAAVRFVSLEPLLGPIDLFHVAEPTGFTFNALSKKEGISFRGIGLDWVIVGGESGSLARPMHPQWCRDIRDQCAAAGVPFFFKQWGEWAPISRGQKLTAKYWFIPDGRLEDIEAYGKLWDESRAYLIGRLGKKAAGRLLDGIEHNGIPT